MAAHGQNKNGLQLEKIGHCFQQYVCVLEKSPKSPILGEYAKGVVVSIICWFLLNFVVVCDIAWWVVAPQMVAVDTICA